MDGNGRWAERKGLPRLEGHRRGAESVDVVVTECRELGIPYLTLYAFSNENWGRPRSEVEGLMELLSTYLQKERKRLVENGIRLNPIGDVDRLPIWVRSLLEDVVRESGRNQAMVLNIALSYSGREELARAARLLCRDAADGRLDPDGVGAEDLDRGLYTAGQPDPDLLIRTGGEQRISNFLLWQLAYTELYFTRTLWPDFRKRHLLRAIDAFNARERRFGLTGAQVKGGRPGRGGRR